MAPGAAFCAILAALCLFLLWPVLALLEKSFFTAGQFAGLDFFRQFIATPGLPIALRNTLCTGLAVTAATLPLSFLLAYAFTNTRFKGRGPGRSLALLPLFIPSFLPAIGLIYLFGAQGLASSFLGEIPLYGPLGVFLGCLIFSLPHALLPLITALEDIDPALYVAARTLGAGPWRRFWRITLPGARYGLISSGIVTFVLSITDFGVPKVLGGDFSMLSTEIFKQIIGMQNFNLGATVSLVLLLPCLPAFLIDRLARRRQRFKRSGQFTLPAASGARDAAFTALGWFALLLPVLVVGVVIWGSFVTFWPYELEPGLANYDFGQTIYGLAPLGSSLLLAGCTALGGVVFIFCGSYLAERCHLPRFLKACYRLLAMLPLALPGTVLGLAYVFAFNNPHPPWQAFYGTIPFLACNCVVHFYTVCHFTFSGSLSRLDPNYESAGACLGASRLRTFRYVIVPMQNRTIADVAFYLFVNALTTVSAVIFLYAPGSPPASVAILQMLDSGALAQASAMGTLLLLSALLALFFRRLPGLVLKRFKGER
ncbi:MAG: ABC transporter permease subunit [Deltaproteobacteria bacterium]|nr:ABC transporter permease subunit [Deltaproteobacteria bacterium]